MKNKIPYWSLKETSLDGEPATLDELKRYIKNHHENYYIDLNEIKEKEDLSEQNYNELKEFIKELRV